MVFVSVPVVPFIGSEFEFFFSPLPLYEHTLTYVRIKTSLPWNVDGVDVWLHSFLTLALDGGE